MLRMISPELLVYYYLKLNKIIIISRNFMVKVIHWLIMENNEKLRFSFFYVILRLILTNTLSVVLILIYECNKFPNRERKYKKKQSTKVPT